MKNNFFAILGLSIFVLISGVSANGGENIQFPVPELGNCGDQAQCRAYCEDVEHMDSCVSFALLHGLMTQEEADRASKFKDAMRNEGGPGACRDPRVCEAYCSEVSHLDECIKFAESQGYEGREVEEGRKLKVYLEEGGEMPGGCRSQADCERYCGDFEHLNQCLALAKKLNLRMQERHTGGEISTEKMEMVIELMKAGQTPGGCTSREGCEAYCVSEEHMEECRAFGERIGFSAPEEIKIHGGTEVETRNRMMQEIRPMMNEEQYREQYEEQYKRQYEEQREYYNNESETQYQHELLPVDQVIMMNQPSAVFAIFASVFFAPLTR